MSLRVAVYSRYSSDLQRDTSLDDQIRCCREYAARHGWIWQDTQVYTDAAISGATIDGRAGLAAILAAAAQRPRPFDVLLVDDSSRVARDIADAIRFLQHIRFAGARVIYISQGIDSASDQAETLVAVHGIVDGLYLKELSSKIKRGLVGQLERGFATGAATYGYRTVPVLDPAGRTDRYGQPIILGYKHVVHDAEAAIVRRIFQMSADGSGRTTILERLNGEGVPGPKGGTWKTTALRWLLNNERYLGRQIWGQQRWDRVPGTRHKTARNQPRDTWRVVERPDLRIIDDALWAAVQARQAAVGAHVRQACSNLYRGRNAALFSKHLFSGFLRCGCCGGTIGVVTGGYGSPRYGCVRRARNGTSACANRLTVRAKVADARLLEGLRAELLNPETVRYITEQVTEALNVLKDRRPAQRQALIDARDAAAGKLRHLVQAIEQGAGAASLFQAMRTREAEIATLEAQLAAAADDMDHRLAVMPTWVRQQLEQTADLLREVPERAKHHFQQLGIGFTVRPVEDEGDRPFLRAEGAGRFADLAFARYVTLSTFRRIEPRL